MKLSLFDQVVFRIPQFPVDATLEESWEELKLSIRQASPNFYQMIKDVTVSEIPKQTEAVQFTIAKYFNRSRFRPTPYGTFASIGVCRLKRETISELIIEEDRLQVIFPDWKQTEGCHEVWKEVPKEKIKVQANSTCYFTNEVIRYIFKNNSRFELSEVTFYTEIVEILKRCNNAIGYNELLSCLEETGLEHEALLEIIDELIDSQLILTNYHPNILGEDYFARTNAPDKDEQQQYMICKATVLSGGINRSVLNELQELVFFMEGKLDVPASTEALAAFTKGFLKKYDGQAIPVMEALDPVTGIGYGDMEQGLQESKLVNLILQNKHKLDEGVGDSGFKTALFDRVVKNTPCSEIDLAELDIKASPNIKLALPNTFSALVRFVDQYTIVENLGGATASSLPGRFNLADDNILELGKQIAATEQSANQDVLFFDVAYCGEPSVDNINRRRSTYKYELGILSYGDNNCSLNLSDVYLRVQGNELILFSASLDKRLIPRLSTAYNYTRSDLSLFRLLCDIQSQGLRHTILPDWKKIFSGIGQTPRVVYKNLILQPKGIEVGYVPRFEEIAVFEKHMFDTGLGCYIKVGYADQTLLINITVTEDLLLLRSILKVKKTLWLQEAFAEKDTVVKDCSGRGYKSEFLLSLYHKNRVYVPAASLPQLAPAGTRSFVPGQSWLYYELYCHPVVGNEILQDVHNLVIALNDQIACWFFIRYNEGGDHIRLRLKGKTPECLIHIFKAVSEVTASLLRDNLLRDVKLCTYNRELERYGAADMEMVEQLFCYDSQYVMELLSLLPEKEQLYNTIIDEIRTVGTAIFGVSGIYDIVKGNQSWMGKEHKIITPIYKEINTTYRKKSDNDMLSGVEGSTRFMDSIIHLLRNVGTEHQVQLFTDLFHMHINRCFSENQRIHEFLIYEYVAKYMKELSFRSVSSYVSKDLVSKL